jgi:uncharacterized protein (TIGR02284 family)
MTRLLSAASVGDSYRGVARIMMIDNDAPKEALERLLKMSFDGQLTFRYAADYVQSSKVEAHFIARAAECGRACQAFIKLMSERGISVRRCQEAAEKVQKRWISGLQPLGNTSDLTILHRCGRGEAEAIKAYITVLATGCLPEMARRLVEVQLALSERSQQYISYLTESAAVTEMSR